MTSEAQKRAQSKYDKKNTRSILFKFNLTGDADILSKLDNVENKQGYVKDLIRKDMRKESKILMSDDIKHLVRPVAKKFKIDKIYIFGSYARGEATEDSDVDLMIEGGEYSSIFGYVDMKDAFKSALGKEVDIVESVVVNNPKTRTARRLREYIEKDKVLIYG